MSYSTKDKLPQFGVCIDWETSGSTWGGDSSIEHQGVSIGAIVFKVDSFEEVASIYREIKFDADKYTWSMGAEKIHGLSREHLETNGVSAEDAATDLLELILHYIGPGEKVMFLGHNAGFDISFTNQLLRTVGFEIGHIQQDPAATFIQLHHVVLDTSSTGLIALSTYRSNSLFELMGFDKRGAHCSLDDARMTLQTAAGIRQLAAIGLQTITEGC